jgi:hypothetical protein
MSVHPPSCFNLRTPEQSLIITNFVIEIYLPRNAISVSGQYHWAGLSNGNARKVLGLNLSQDISSPGRFPSYSLIPQVKCRGSASTRSRPLLPNPFQLSEHLTAPRYPVSVFKAPRNNPQRIFYLRVLALRTIFKVSNYTIRRGVVAS